MSLQEHALGDVMPPLVTVHIVDLFTRRSSDLFDLKISHF